MPITIDGELVDPVRGMSIDGSPCDITIDGETVHFKSQYKLHLEYFTVHFNGEQFITESSSSEYIQYYRINIEITHRSGKGKAPGISGGNNNLRISCRSSYDGDGVEPIVLEQDNAPNREMNSGVRAQLGDYISSSSDSIARTEEIEEGETITGHYRFSVDNPDVSDLFLGNVQYIGNCLQVGTETEGDIVVDLSDVPVFAP